jgi:hypothetical protein
MMFATYTPLWYKVIFWILVGWWAMPFGIIFLIIGEIHVKIENKFGWNTNPDTRKKP